LDHIEHLFALSFKFDDISIAHTSLDFDNELFAILNQSLSLAVLAILFVNFAFALACLTWLLHLHLHEAHLDVLNSHTLTITLCAYFLLTAFSS
jgi:hypothetical protein